MSIYNNCEHISIPEAEFDGYIMIPQDAGKSKKYPVLYLFHGTGGVDEWVDPEKVNMPYFMNDWAESSSENVPMIVVFPDIHGCGAADKYVQYQEKLAARVKAIRNKYSDCMLCDCEHTAVAGFSLGGAFALYCAIKNPDLFYHVGGFSPSPFLYCTDGEYASWLKSSKEMVLPDYKNSVRFIGSGSAEGFKSDTDRYYNIFRENGTIFNEGAPPAVVPGGRHCFYTFNKLLREFLDKNIFSEQ